MPPTYQPHPFSCSARRPRWRWASTCRRTSQWSKAPAGCAWGARKRTLHAGIAPLACAVPALRRAVACAAAWVICRVQLHPNAPAWQPHTSSAPQYVGGGEAALGQGSGYAEYARHEVLQMVGRAGRPQFDTEVQRAAPATERARPGLALFSLQVPSGWASERALEQLSPNV